jgi:hypothetical protein
MALDFILTENKLRVTATPAPLLRGDVLFRHLGGGQWQKLTAAVGRDGFLFWRPA